MEKVSVIMPCYNDGKYILEAIESIREQTYSNWEIIIIDDGSDDELTRKTIGGLEKDEQIRIFTTERIGPAGARNYGISQAEGVYILPVDADDAIDKTYIEKAVNILDKNGKVGVVYCLADLFGEKEGIWDLPQYSFETMLLDNIVFVTALFYKKDWELVEGFKTTMKAGMEDYDFWLSILELGKEIYQIPEVLFHYRIKKVSRTTRFLDESEQVKSTYRQVYQNHQKFYYEHADEYAMILRDALIEQIFLRRKYEERWGKIVKISKWPIVGRVIRIMFKE